MKRRVAVTGLGAVCSGGNDIASFSKTVTEGISCLFPINDSRLAHFNGKYAGFVCDFNISDYIGGKDISGFDTYVHFAVEAASQALADAAITPEKLAEKMGLIFATCSGPMLTIEDYYQQKEQGELSISIENLFARKYFGATKVLCHLFGVSGLATTVTTACSASTGAIGIAADLIEQGALTAALVGGADTFSPTTFAGFEGLKVICKTKCAPFSKPIGMNLGEGGAFLVLEDMQHALDRGAEIYAEILGFGMSNDAYHCSAPDLSGRGQALAMKRALVKAGLTPSDIKYVNTHGTGTEANDKSETKAILRVFKDSAGEICISSTKSIVGHCLGAAGALEVIATILCACKGVYPSTVNFSKAREGCTLDYIPEAGRKWNEKKVFMKNNFAFGGNNVSIIMTNDIRQESESEFNESDSANEVWMTSCGVVSPAGIGIESLLSGINIGESFAEDEVCKGVKKLKTARVRPFNERRINRRLDLHNMDNASRYATVAAKLAIQESGIPERTAMLSKLGFYLSLSSGSTKAESEHISALFKNDFQLSQVQAFPYIVPNSIGGNVCRALGLNGHNTVFTAGQCSGVMVLGLAVYAIQAGHVDAILCGGADELLENDLFDNCQMGIWGGENQAVPGEGAAMFLLEKASFAKARGVEPIAIVCGMAFSCDINDMVNADSTTENLERTILESMELAGIDSNDVDRICCMESNQHAIQALKNIFDSIEERSVDVSSIVGSAESTLPLMSLAYTLYNTRFENRRNRNYILSVFSSPEGFNTALIVKKGLRK